MKKVQFNSVKIQNFLSIGEEVFELTFQKGITLITGENKDKGGKNGVGKSSILEAIYWCLFGNTIRDIKTDKIIHNLSDKGTEVCLNFNISTQNKVTNYKITRSLKPSKLNIIANIDQKEEDLTLSTIPETEKYILALIGATEEVFQNAVIMSTNNTLPFMAQKKVDKRKFIEGILNLNIFSEMLLKTRADFNTTKKENDLLSNDFINQQRNLELFETQKQKADDLKREKIQNINKKIEDSKKTIDDLEKEDIPSNKEVKKQIKEVEDKISTLREGISEANRSIIEAGKKYAEEFSELNQKIKEKKKIIEKGDTCPSCNRKYCDDDLHLVDKKIKELDESIENQQSIVDNLKQNKIDKENFGQKLSNGVIKLEKKLKELNQEASKASVHQEKIKNLQEKIKEYEKSIDEITNEKLDFDANIEKTKEKIFKLENDITNIKKDISVLETVKFIVSEEGVKTFIIKKMLSLLNTKLNYYLKLLDTPCKIEFNELFEETIINDTGKECSYHNFSGGERVRINIAVLFMFQDLLRSQSGTSYSLNVYDELLDSAIDQKGAEKILEILRDRIEKYDESIYIVSHNSNIKSNIDNVITLEKINGVTKIIN